MKQRVKKTDSHLEKLCELTKGTSFMGCMSQVRKKIPNEKDLATKYRLMYALFLDKKTEFTEWCNLDGYHYQLNQNQINFIFNFLDEYSAETWAMEMQYNLEEMQMKIHHNNIAMIQFYQSLVDQLNQQ